MRERKGVRYEERQQQYQQQTNKKKPKGRMRREAKKVKGKSDIKMEIDWGGEDKGPTRKYS